MNFTYGYSLEPTNNSLIKEMNIPISLIYIHITHIIPIYLIQKCISISISSFSCLMHSQLVFKSFFGQLKQLRVLLVLLSIL